MASNSRQHYTIYGNGSYVCHPERGRTPESKDPYASRFTTAGQRRSCCAPRATRPLCRAAFARTAGGGCPHVNPRDGCPHADKRERLARVRLPKEGVILRAFRAEASRVQYRCARVRGLPFVNLQSSIVNQL